MISDTVSKNMLSLVPGRTASSASWTMSSISESIHSFPAQYGPYVIWCEATCCTFLQKHGADAQDTSTLWRQLPPVELEKLDVFFSI
jgi:hypothetical protein